MLSVPTRAGRLAFTGLAMALALTSVACGGDDASTVGEPGGNNPTPTSSVDQSLAARVPADIKADGKILIGTDSTYAPNEFLAADGKTIQGFDIDLFNAIAAKLGLTAEFQTAPFDNIIPSVKSGKYELGVSSFTINDERKKVADMVSYFSAGTQWATKAGNPNGINPDDACGKKIAVQKGTVQVDDLTARSKKCTDAGKKAITIEQYQGQDEATAAVVSGKDEAMLADSPVVAYAVKQTNEQLELLGEIYDSAPYGYVVKKDQGEFAQVLADALKAIIADGSYKTALQKWGVEQGAITDPKVSP
ncbi:MAG TPA: ABC transporter substrate-binding protein [Frankiaceae bacterium]|nr:ABC transporter substrate-binding protein [Frankiaceae bacterium]